MEVISNFSKLSATVECFSNKDNIKVGEYSNQDILSLDNFNKAKIEIESWDGYKPTTLHSLKDIAIYNNVEEILYKDEYSRFSLKSFKALGGAYAVSKLLIEELKKNEIDANSDDLISGRYAGITAKITVCCATDGNHGRSVAWGSKMFGCGCEIYIHKNVSIAREKAIAKFGANVHRIDGNYDDSVHIAAKVSADNNYFVVSDTSYEGYTEIPKSVMQGYTIMVDEAINQINKFPTHVFLQGGVGGLAAAVVSYFIEYDHINTPIFVVVEPSNADCLFQSAKSGIPTIIEGDLETVMAGLACGEVSLLAWEILKNRVNHFMVIDDLSVAPTMQLLASSSTPIISGESAVAGLSGFLLAAKNDSLREELNIDSNSRILCFGTEGDTDEEAYTVAVGKSSQDIIDSANN
ncbi:MAG TPA: diaminopropionate ammonia-lyase [Gammaproteobacteria bacterium]|nr:diaminopropionate ammonia-lyase [Gammaproteobacteria bacterium]